MLKLAAAASAAVALFAATARAAVPFQAVEVVARVTPQLPDGTRVSAPADLAPDDAHLILQVKGPSGDQIAVAGLDGGGFACLTCGMVESAFKPTVSADGTKVFFADNKGDNSQEGNPFSGGTGDFNWSILECAPSVYDCRRRAVLPVDFPIAGLGEGAQNREAKFDPLVQHVSWNEVRAVDGPRVTIAKLVRGGDRYELADPRVLNPTGHSGLQAAEDEGRFYEGANFADGGRTLTYQTTTTASNYDSWRIDLATGAREPLTADLDYNEISRYSPDGRSVFFSSARGLDRMRVFTQLVRPSLFDAASFGSIGRVSLHGNRGCMQGGWLAARDVPQRADGYQGQPLLLGDDQNVRDWEWFADGRRALISIQPFTRDKTPKDIPSDLYIVRLPGLHPRPACRRARWMPSTGGAGRSRPATTATCSPASAARPFPARTAAPSPSSGWERSPPARGPSSTTASASTAHRSSTAASRSPRSCRRSLRTGRRTCASAARTPARSRAASTSAPRRSTAARSRARSTDARSRACRRRRPAPAPDSPRSP